MPVGKRFFLEFLFCFTSINLSLPGPLRTAFELKNHLKTSKNQPDVTERTENVINCLKRSKTIKIFFNFFPKLPQNQKWQIWGDTSPQRKQRRAGKLH